MEFHQYDRVLLKNGLEASIVEVFGNGEAFLADIDEKNSTVTETILKKDIEKKLER